MLSTLALAAILLNPIEPLSPLRDRGYGISQVELLKSVKQPAYKGQYEEYCGIHPEKEECQDMVLEIAL